MNARLITTFFIIATSACAPKSGAPPSETATASSATTEAVDLADAAMKGHLLSVLMFAVDAEDGIAADRTAFSANTSALHLSRDIVDAIKPQFRQLPEQILALYKHEGERLAQTWTEYQHVSSANGELYEQEPSPVAYRLELLDGSREEDFARAVVPYACRYLPARPKVGGSWMNCVSTFDTKQKTNLKKVGAYGASLAQASYFRKMTKVPADRARPVTDARILSMVRDLREKIQSKTVGEGLTPAERDLLRHSWRSLGVASITDNELGDYEVLLNSFSLYRLTALTAEHLNKINQLLRTRPPESRRRFKMKSGWSASSDDLQELVRRHQFTFGVAGATSGILERARYDKALTEDVLQTFANELVKGLIEHWNGQRTRSEVLTTALRALPASTWKDTLRERLNAIE